MNSFFVWFLVGALTKLEVESLFLYSQLSLRQTPLRREVAARLIDIQRK